MPSKLEKIGSYAFHGCSSLSGITIPDSVTCIEKYAFYEAGLKTAILPNPTSWHTATLVSFKASGGTSPELLEVCLSNKTDFDSSGSYNGYSGSLHCNLSEQNTAAIALTQTWNGKGYTYYGNATGSYNVTVNYYTVDWVKR